MASRTHGSLARGVGEARAIAGLGRPEPTGVGQPLQTRPGRGVRDRGDMVGGRRRRVTRATQLQQSGGML